jgi:hypothetical protein
MDIFSRKDVSTLFGNISDLNRMHLEFYSDLVLLDPGDVHGLTHIIEKHIPTMNLAYSNYCSNFPHATAYYNRLVKIAPKKRIGSTNSLGYHLRIQE